MTVKHVIIFILFSFKPQQKRGASIKSVVPLVKDLKKKRDRTIF